MNNLLRLIGRRLVALPIMVVGVSFLVFFIMSLSPIDPAYSALGETATPEALEEYRVQHGLNDPFFVQYGHYLWNMLHGDLGTYGVGTSNHVTDLVAQALPSPCSSPSSACSSPSSSPSRSAFSPPSTATVGPTRSSACSRWSASAPRPSGWQRC